MKNLFNTSDNKEIIDRIGRLTANSKAEWGKMSAGQMLVHAQRPLQVAFGELKLKRTLIGLLFGNMAKKKLARGEEPFSKNLPTDKNFIVTDQHNVEEEKTRLIALVQKFAQVGPEGITKEPHPFFGIMTTQEWDTLMCKHLDHHLRQFGV
jgi:hypothetical protein